MSDNYVGEIRPFAGNFTIQGWAQCNGATLSISQFSVLFTLIGTTFGGDGTTTFNLPDLRGRVPLGQGQGTGLGNYVLGQTGGVEQVTLNGTQIPGHSHVLNATSNPATSGTPSSSMVLGATGSGTTLYGALGTTSTLAAGAIGNTGNTLPHDNIQPTTALTYIIALFGVFPSQ